MTTKVVTAEDVENEYHSWCDYKELVSIFGWKVLHYEEFGSYQGDAVVIFEDEGRYGVLGFGYGSCSVCDALQGCSSAEEVADLANGFIQSTRWFDTKEEIVAYANSEWAATENWWLNDQEIVDVITKWAGEDEQTE